MALLQILAFILLGGLAGWLAGILVRGHGYGIIANVLIGIVGALVGGLIFSWLGVPVFGGFAGSLLTAIVGAVALLFVAGLLGRITGARA